MPTAESKAQANRPYLFAECPSCGRNVFPPLPGLPLASPEKLSDQDTVDLYRWWCQAYHCTSFMPADDGTVREFIRWLRNGNESEAASEAFGEHERDLLRTFRRLVPGALGH